MLIEKIIVKEVSCAFNVGEKYEYNAIITASNENTITTHLEGQLIVNGPNSYSTVENGNTVLNIKEFRDKLTGLDLIEVIKPELVEITRKGIRYPFVVRSNIKELEEEEY